VIKYYRLVKLLGYYIIDNILDNNIILREVSRYLFITKGVIYEVDEYRLRYFSHVVSLIINAFIVNKPLKATRVKRLLGVIKEDKPL
jgi:hypothetical protein